MEKSLFSSICSPVHTPPKLTPTKFLRSPTVLEHINQVLPTNRSEHIGSLAIGTTICIMKEQILVQNNISAIVCCNKQAYNLITKKVLIKTDRKLQINLNNRNMVSLLYLQMEDSPHQNISRYFNEAYEFIQQNRLMNKNVLVQCHAGVSRSATILLAYLMKKDLCKFISALDLLKSKRSRVKPNFGFYQQLSEYQKQLKFSNLDTSCSNIKNKKDAFRANINNRPFTFDPQDQKATQKILKIQQQEYQTKIVILAEKKNQQYYKKPFFKEEQINFPRLQNFFSPKMQNTKQEKQFSLHKPNHIHNQVNYTTPGNILSKQNTTIGEHQNNNYEFGRMRCYTITNPKQYIPADTNKNNHGRVNSNFLPKKQQVTLTNQIRDLYEIKNQSKTFHSNFNIIH